MKTLTAEEFLNSKGIKNHPLDQGIGGSILVEYKRYRISDAMESYASQFHREISEEEIERMADELYPLKEGKYKNNLYQSERKRAYIAGALDMLPYTRKQEWISVEERLPEENKDVLCLGRITNRIYVYFCNYSPEDKKSFIEHHSHWMPLPAPPVK